jgi:hypothetical protein
MKKWLYLLLLVIGTVLPYSQLVAFAGEHGFAPAVFFEQLFANRVAAMNALDVLISSAVLWVFVYAEGARLGMKHLWVYVVANLLGGVSVGLPLFLLMREVRLEQAEQPRAVFAATAR